MGVSTAVNEVRFGTLTEEKLVRLVLRRMIVLMA